MSVQTIRTVGHGSASADDLGDLLTAAEVGMVVDVRRYPGSRRHPQFSREALAGWLTARGIAYRWLEGLGGRRRITPDSVNEGLRNEQLRAYGDHMASPEFEAAVAELLELASTESVAVMCAESLWWRCHRRLLADHLDLVEGVSVEHLLHTGRYTTHPLTAGARREGNRVVYDRVQLSFPGHG